MSLPLCHIHICRRIVNVLRIFSLLITSISRYIAKCQLIHCITNSTFVSIFTKLSNFTFHIKCRFVDCSKFKTLCENHMGFNRQTVRHTKTILGGTVWSVKTVDAQRLTLNICALIIQKTHLTYIRHNVTFLLNLPSSF